MPLPLGTAESFWSRVGEANESGCREWQGYLTPKGYGALMWQGQNWQAHRLALTLVAGPIPGGLCVCHSCDNRKCCNPDHLSIGTNGDNNADMVAKGRLVAPEGERNGNAILTTAGVIALRTARARGANVTALGRALGVSKAVAHAAATGRTWKCVS